MMSKFICFLFLIILLVLSPIPQPGTSGIYNPISRSIWCTTKSSCIHEIAHKLDQEAGWISKSNEFKLAISLYIHFDEIDVKILGKTYPELYAGIFQKAGGQAENIPEPLRKFYDFPRAAKLLEKYVR